MKNPSSTPSDEEFKPLAHEKLEEVRRIHAPVIKTMDSMGFGLLRDGKTFYKYGYTTKPREHTTFTMTQAYEIDIFIARHTNEAVLQARIDELDKSMDSFAKGPDYEFLLRARKRKAELAPSGQSKGGGE